MRRCGDAGVSGELGLMDAGNQRLVEFGEEWWRLYAEPNLARNTLRIYAMLWDKHILPRLGDLKLRELTPEVLQRYRLELEAAGVPRATTRKALVLLQGILQRAVEWNRLAVNPMRAVAKPRAGSTRLVQPLSPETVEAMRNHLIGTGHLRDATLISVLAYAGLRPGEALALTLGQHPGAHSPGRGGGRARRDRPDQDSPRSHGAAASSAGAGPRRVADALRPPTGLRARLPRT